MKIAIVTSIVPFIQGGARTIVSSTEQALAEAGHDVEVVALPCLESPSRIISQLGLFRTVDLTGQADLAICIRPPAYLIRHPRKVLWFIHHFRTYYDLWNTEYRRFGDTAIARARRDVIHRVDRRAFEEASAIFTNSQVVTDRLRTYNNIDAEVLYPPLPSELFVPNRGLGDEIVMVSRLEHHKRQHLLVEALGLTESPIRLRLIGAASDPSYTAFLRRLGEEAGVGSRLVVEDRWASESEKQQFVGSALAASYVPIDEDSYGYPVLEAATASKAILTTNDSGGVLEFVQHGRSGLICEPTPHSVADAMDALWRDRAATEAMGRNAHLRIDQLKISWDHVVGRLTA